MKNNNLIFITFALIVSFSLFLFLKPRVSPPSEFEDIAEENKEANTPQAKQWKSKLMDEDRTAQHDHGSHDHSHDAAGKAPADQAGIKQATIVKERIIDPNVFAKFDGGDRMFIGDIFELEIFPEVKIKAKMVGLKDNSSNISSWSGSTPDKQFPGADPKGLINTWVTMNHKKKLFLVDAMFNGLHYSVMPTEKDGKIIYTAREVRPKPLLHSHPEKAEASTKMIQLEVPQPK